MSLFSTVSKGKAGEKFVCKFLKKKRYKIIQVNMRNKYSEIDIIAENRDYIVFVEVKTRTSDFPIRPLEAVNSQKQQKIMLAANYFLTCCYNTSKQPRFDVAEVFMTQKGKLKSINYIENAFIQGGNYAVL
ncbi:MAG: YraN family protein [Ruminococcaceae bacterium]|nr:YraN family protein [Oscillospiraceae bacterium]